MVLRATGADQFTIRYGAMMIARERSASKGRADDDPAARRRRGRSLAILAALLTLAGLFYAVSMVRVAETLARRDAGRPPAAP